MSSSQVSSSLLSFLVPLAFCLIIFSNPGKGFEITNSSVDVRATEGDTVTLYCKADDFFEYCTWSHKVSHGLFVRITTRCCLNLKKIPFLKRSYCEFEWKSTPDSVERQRCSVSLARRIRFVGNYPDHECKVELRGVSQERDSGEWECQVESYVWGVGRGWTVRNKINVTVVPEKEEEEEQERKSLPCNFWWVQIIVIVSFFFNFFKEP